MIESAKVLVSEPVYLVIGGFNLGNANRVELNDVVTAFHHLGVQKVGPSHCTGNKAIEMFADSYGEDFIRVEVGQVLVVE